MPSGERLPKLRHHSTGQFFIRINGDNYYLGADEVEAETRRLRVLKEWKATGRLPQRRQAAAGDARPTVASVCAAYHRRCKDRYALPDGGHAPEIKNVALALRPVLELYGSTPAAEFDGVRLVTVRKGWVDAGRARKSINKDVDRIRRCFKWGVAFNLVPPDTLQKLCALEPLQPGEGGVAETPDVPPVPPGILERTLPLLSAQVRAMVELQFLTGARPGEVCRLRPCDVIQAGELELAPGHTVPLGGVWVYRPRQHKTAYLGRQRFIPLGPRARAVLRPFLDRPTEACCFSPVEAEAARDAQRRQRRKTPLWPSHVRHQARKRKASPRKTPGTSYTPSTYANAIANAIERANREMVRDAATKGDHPPAPIGHWHPHQLRHNAATWIGREFGKDGPEIARIVLGHRSLAMTKHYMLEDLEKALKAMERAG